MSAPSRARTPERLAPALIALTVLAAVVRFSTLSVQSYWLDEAVTIDLLHHSFGGMLSAIPDSESTPPLYYVVAWVWAKLFGTGEVGLRSLSALFATATVPLAYLAGSRIVTRRAGLALAALAAVNPLLVWFSQEARAYALLALLATASLWLFARALERPSGRALAGWAVVSALALAAHYFAVFVIAPQAVWLLWRLRRRALPALAGIALAGAALLPLAVHQAGNDRAGFIHAIALGRRVVQVPKQYLVGFDAPLEALATVVALALSLYAVWLLARRGDEGERGGAWTAACIAVPALGVPLVLALVGVDYLITRNLIGAWVPLMAIVAAGLGVRRAPRAGAVATAALCGVMLAVLVSVEANPAYQRGDWRGAADRLGPPPSPGRILVVTPPAGSEALGVYLRHLGPMPAGFPRTGEIAIVAMAERKNGVTPKPPRPHALVPPPSGFAAPTVTLGDTYTIVRYRAVDPAGAGVDVFTAGALQFVPGLADFRFQPPR
jgi:mannosyltransferase